MSKTRHLVGRERFLAIAFILIVATFGARLVQLQIFEHPQWKEIAERQSHLTTFRQPNRGEIHDHNGAPLAVSLPLTYAIGFRPCDSLDLDETADQIAPFLFKPRREIRSKLNSPAFTYLARKVDWEAKLNLERLGLTCLQFDEEPRRSYPSGSAAATVLGFTNREGHGVEGIEAYMDGELSGEACRELCRVDALRKAPAPIAPAAIELHGADVTTTIDLQLQSIVDEGLQQGLQGRDYQRAGAILIDPQSGDILALATWPTFDPNAPGDVRPEVRRCWLITDVYEPGSTAKIIPVAIALESGRYRRSSRIFCENGSYKVPGTVIHDSHPHGELTLDDVLAFSSNIGAAKVNSSFSPNIIYDKLRAFGFGNLTSVGIAGEQAGEIPPPSRWSGPTRATLAYGHGMSCTALQLAMAYASIANGGLLLKPRLIKEVHYPNGTSEDFPVEVIRRTVPAPIADQLTDMLIGVVEHGTGTTAKIEGIAIAGKTGTAEKVDFVNRTYFSNRYVASFAGFFPADHPRYVLLVIVDDPRGEHYGGTVAGPVFKAIVEQIAAVRPGEFPLPPTPPSEMVEVPQDSAAQAEAEQIRLAAIQAMPATASNAMFIGNTFGDSTMVRVPLLKGMSMRRAVEELSRSRLGFRIIGVRTVTTQSPAPGTMVPVGTLCELYGMAE